MSGVAAITSCMDPNEIWLYTVTKAQQLSLEIRKKDSHTYELFRDFGAVKGPVITTTGLAAVIHNKTNTVYGITSCCDEKKETVSSGDKKKKTVSSLSPVCNPIDDTTTNAANPGEYNAIAAASNEESDYVYFLKDQDGVSQKPDIIEYGFKQSNTGDFTVYKHMEPDPSSNLAAVMEARNGTRMIIFQDYKKPGLFYIWSDNKTRNPIHSSNNARQGTPLAATLVAFEDKTFEVYLYYVDNNEDSPQLQRIIYAGTEKGGVWGSPARVIEVSSVHGTSGLAVVSGSEGNYIFYKSNSDRYMRHFDKYKKRLLVNRAETSDEVDESTGREGGDNTETNNGGAKLEDRQS